MGEPFQRASPLAARARPGRFGADHGPPGVILAVRHPLSIVAILARRDGRALDRAIRSRIGAALPAAGRSASGASAVLHWCGADQWYAVSPVPTLYRDLGKALAGFAAVVDQSHGRLTFAIDGPKSRELLAKGTSVDLHPAVFGPGRCAVTQMAHIGVHLAQTGADAFELSVFRGFSESFWEWLTTMAEEFGYQVR